MKDFDVHFQLKGIAKLEADTPSEARKDVENMIEELKLRTQNFTDISCEFTEGYTTDVVDEQDNVDKKEVKI